MSSKQRSPKRHASSSARFRRAEIPGRTLRRLGLEVHSTRTASSYSFSGRSLLRIFATQPEWGGRNWREPYVPCPCHAPPAGLPARKHPTRGHRTMSLPAEPYLKSISSVLPSDIANVFHDL